jgi:hypothetical protein
VPVGGVAESTCGAFDLFDESVDAFGAGVVTPEAMNASIAGHQVSTVPARVLISSMSA